ncbi:MAG TPA: T9SS type A sorting domain-containing protein [Bacteroidia bacterium]|nr:T9SS type A sorting domain-containing protein [Bacteroidia bacterium]
MKKLLTLIPFALNSLLLSAQPYGQTQYPSGSTMTSGYTTFLNPLNRGFIMAGLAGGPLFHIDKTRTGGSMPSFNSTLSFERDYFVAENGTCTSSPLTSLTLLGGVCAKEIVPVNSGTYAVAGAYSEGCFISFLAPDGSVNNTLTFPFPATALTANRPTIVQDPGTLDIYMCGSYNSDMYVIKINSSGAVAWSAFYNGGSAILMEPRDMIISSHNGQIIIVGHMSPDFLIYGSASDAFFLALNPSSGNVITFRNYTSTPCNWFNSVKNANCPLAGGIGYVVGGFTDYTPNASGPSLMMKLSPTGTVLWNTLISPGSPGIVAFEINGVVERLKPSGQYEYYGVAESNDLVSGYSEITVYKLDAFGNPAAGINEYHYTSSSSSQPTPINLSFQNSGPAADVGLHVFADDNVSGHYLLESYFNGVTGCSNDNFTNILMTEPGPNMFIIPISKFGSLSICNKLNITQVVAGTTPNILCSSMSVSGGSNLRLAPAEEGSMTETQIYPNPGNGLYTIETALPAQITIVNLLGEIVQETTITSGKSSIDLLKEESGVYIVKVFDGHETKILRVVKN